MSDKIFVFGSNLAGNHGAGAAYYARKKKGAKMGQAVGLQGCSYAIPTKNKMLKTLPLETISLYVEEFLMYASLCKNKRFKLTPIGCGLAGYNPEQIAPMFKNAPTNVELPQEFINVLEG